MSKNQAIISRRVERRRALPYSDLEALEPGLSEVPVGVASSHCDELNCPYGRCPVLGD
jgi:hypothetical protein